MRHDPLPPFQTEAPLPDIPFARVDGLLREIAGRIGAALHTGHGRSTWCKLDGGEFGARMGPEGSILYARAHSRAALIEIRQTFVSELQARLVSTGPLQWSSIDKPGAFPPNFCLARVERVRAVGTGFLRVRLSAHDLHRFAGQQIHFRLILQPPGTRDPQWPVIGTNGQTVWPEGAAKLHRPAYTVRRIDAAAGWMETDIFIHSGGRASSWAAAARPGDEVGLTGPGGGGIPLAHRLLIGADETGYPAMARIIEAQAPEATGLCIRLGRCADYPLPAHPGIRVIDAPGGEARLARRLSLADCAADAIWIATERHALEALKTALAGRGPATPHLAAYWTRPTVGR